MLSHIPYLEGDQEPRYAIADAYEPPHALSLPLDVCDRVRKGAEGTVATPSGNGTYFYEPDIDDGDRQAIHELFTAANRQWWGLEVDRWVIGVKRYAAGERHPLHQDLHAGAAGRKLAGVVQLSEPDDYDGGALVMRFAHHAVEMPRARGTLVAFPGWTVHEVTVVTRGVRWSLCVNGWGPRLG
jgi:hypothetical protein